MKLRFLPFFTLGFTASCADQKSSKPAEASAPVHKSLSQRLDEDAGFKQDSNGNWVPRADRRSSFEGKGESPYFKGDYAKKEFEAEGFQKKSWWGNKDFGRPGYEGNTDGSRFQTKSRMDGTAAREAGAKPDLPGTYQTDNFATNAAREAGRDAISKMADAETMNRQAVYEQPEIVDWREQRRLSMEESKGILGR